MLHYDMKINVVISVHIDEIVPSESHGQRLDKYITDIRSIVRADVAQSIKNGHVMVNGLVISKCSHKVHTDDHVVAHIQQRILTSSLVVPQNYPLDIYYQDEHIVVLYKPKGLITHPGAGHQDGTLLNAIAYHFPQTQSVPKGGLVQRLDKDTSGLMVVALTVDAYQKLVDMMQKRRITRRYHALVWGRPPESMTIEAPLGRHKRDRRMRAVVVTGRTAVTVMRTLAYGVWGSLVECTLKTGRTHQIRVHMKHIGYPVCGDMLYGVQHPPLASPIGWSGQALHAKHLAFHHPIDEQPLSFEAPFPEGWDIWKNNLGVQYEG